jgi:hypothetical protein
MPDPQGLLVTPVGFRTDGSIHAFELDASDRLKIAVIPNAIYDSTGLTQLLIDNTATNAEVTVYTVPAAKTAYLTDIWMSLVNGAAANATCVCRIYNAVPTLVYSQYLVLAAGGLQSVADPQAVPLRLLTGWSVRVFSSLALAVARVAIKGYEL